MVKKSKIDEIDIKILEFLEENSRIKNTKIAKALGLTEAAIRKRIEKLIKNNIIRKFTIVVDYKAFGYKNCIIGINVQKNKIFDVIKNILKTKKIKSLYISIGDHDILLEFVYKNQKDLENFIEILKKIEGVENICPAIIVDRIL
ncbi:MAG: Lrp/AsnC family transcriptional regulator [Nanopusillaceae archaeon]